MNTTSNELHTQHISQQFNHELSELKSHLLVMGGMVEQQVQNALKALVEGDSHLAESVRDRDKEVDKLERTIDEEATRVIARRQPAASDLRLVVSVIKMVADLERVGDEAKKIAKFAIALAEEGQAPRGYVEVRHIGNHVSQMVRDGLDAFARFDTELALAVMKEDESVDNEYRSATRALVTFMMEDPRSISRCLNIMWILRALERVGDHANNLAEHVIFMVKGTDVRHVPLSEAEKAVED
ncbi:phosphate signaling complex protein PhoU [Marinobacteraceae bacterium S3BR75-40.1]